MDNMDSQHEDVISSLLWTFDEGHNIDEVKKQLQQTKDELQMVRIALAKTRQDMMEQDRKYKQNIIQLIFLLHIALKEKDEAEFKSRQLMIAMNSSQHTSGGGNTGQPPLSPPALLTTCHVASLPPLPRQVNNNIGPPQNQVNTLENMVARASVWAGSQVGDAVIEKLAQGRPKPNKGKLYETVVSAGPLLNSLMSSVPQGAPVALKMGTASHVRCDNRNMMRPYSSQEGERTQSRPCLLEYGNAYGTDHNAMGKRKRTV